MVFLEKTSNDETAYIPDIFLLLLMICIHDISSSMQNSLWKSYYLIKGICNCLFFFLCYPWLGLDFVCYIKTWLNWQIASSSRNLCETKCFQGFKVHRHTHKKTGEQKYEGRTAVKSSSSLHVTRDLTFYKGMTKLLKKTGKKRREGQRENDDGKRKGMLTHWGCRISIYLPYIIVASTCSCLTHGTAMYTHLQIGSTTGHEREQSY